MLDTHSTVKTIGEGVFFQGLVEFRIANSESEVVMHKGNHVAF
jgi:hypothetical protein